MELTVKRMSRLSFVAAILTLVYQLWAADGARSAIQTSQSAASEVGAAVGQSDRGFQPMTAMSHEHSFLYADIKELASIAGVSLLSYEAARRDESIHPPLRAQGIVFQVASTYPNLTLFLSSVQKAYPQMALLSVVMDRKVAGLVGATQPQSASAELLVSVRLRAYGLAEGGQVEGAAASATATAPEVAGR
ncbi:hypothetical protein [Roseateles asaccharophilus]|uniref:Uncharacterized protein n=1 Tax=Roseateles asaccharophilus TaxID=582607 RepID=A0ABU2ADX9_9BURK|nr:hypothetical protein [Roseateles asaccharophilus]MDR7335404.1 hypothetical protein [Roseateles asaccharophilus]